MPEMSISSTPERLRVTDLYDSNTLRISLLSVRACSIPTVPFHKMHAFFFPRLFINNTPLYFFGILRYNNYYNAIWESRQMSETGLSKQNYFTFQLGKGLFAVPVTSVKEVLHYEPITPVPKALPYLKGVINIRGTVVPVADFRVLFGFTSEKPLEQTMLIITEIDQKDDQPLVLGLIADGVDVVCPLQIVPSETIEYVTLPQRKEFIYAVGKKNDTFVLIINMENILSSIRSVLSSTSLA